MSSDLFVLYSAKSFSKLEEAINSKDVSLDLTDSNGNTLLHNATIDNNDYIVKCLIGAGADVSKQNLQKKSALILSIIHNNDCFFLLVDITSGEEKNRALTYAVRYDNYFFFSYLIKCGSDVNTRWAGMTLLELSRSSRISTELIKAGTQITDIAFIKACESDLLLAKLMLQSGFNANCITASMFETLLFMDYSLCQFLLDNGYVPNNLYSPFNKAINNVAVFVCFLEWCSSNFEYHKYIPTDAIFKVASISSDNPTVLKILINSGYDINYKDFNKNNALVYAMMAGNIKIFKYLANNGCNINNTGEYNKTPLMHALQIPNLKNRTSYVKILIEAGADTKILNYMEENALMIASKSACIENVMMLINTGIDVDRQDNFGRTALINAIINYRTEVAKILIPISDVSIIDYYGNNALSLAESRKINTIISAIVNKIENKSKIIILNDDELTANQRYHYFIEGLHRPECEICNERPVSRALKCKHLLCTQCNNKVSICPFCREYLN